MKLVIANLYLLLSSCNAESIRGKGITRRLEEECKAIIQDVNYGPGKKSKENLMCETPSGLVYKVKNSSQYEIDQVKKTMGKKGHVDPLLIFSSPAHINEETQEIESESPPKLVERPGRPSRKLAGTTGTKSVLVVRVVTSDKKNPTASLGALSDSVFGNNADGDGTDTVNLKSQYAVCSHKKLNFVEASDRNGSGGVNIRNGAVEVKIGRSSAENDGTIVNEVTSQLQSVFGVYPNQLADHVMYCLPPLSTSWGIAYAYINSWNSVYHDEWCRYLSTQMHEIGHNLGLAHAGESAEYDDQSGMMGYSYPELDGPEMCFNAAKSWQLGWYNARHLTLNRNEAYYGELGSIVHENSDQKPAIIKINSIESSTDLYITFNWANNFNIGTQEGGNQVLVVETGSEGNGYSPSDLLGKQYAGTNTYTLGDETVTVKVTSINTKTGYANVEICYGVCLNPPTRVPTISPTKEPSHPTSKPTSYPTSAPTLNSWLACRTDKANKKAKECLKIQGCTWISGQCMPSTSEPTAKPSKKPTVSPSVRPSLSAIEVVESMMKMELSVTCPFSKSDIETLLSSKLSTVLRQDGVSTQVSVSVLDDATCSNRRFLENKLIQALIQTTVYIRDATIIYTTGSIVEAAKTLKGKKFEVSSVDVVKLSDSPTRTPTAEPTRKPTMYIRPTKSPTDAPTPSNWQNCRTTKANKKAKDCLKISGCTWFQNSCRHSSSIQALDEFTPPSDDCASIQNRRSCRSSESCVWRNKTCMNLN